MFSDVEIIHVTEEIPEANRHNPNSFRIWAEFIRKIIPEPIDYVFASEQYGFKLAAELAAEFIPVDPGRTNFPVSATEIRKDPYANWNYLTNVVKPYFARQVCCVSQQIGVPGAESHPARALAQHYHTVCVADALERWMTLRARPQGSGELDLVFRSQIAAAEALLPLCNKVLFAEADLLTLQARLQIDTPEFRADLSRHKPADLYILHYDSTHTARFSSYLDTLSTTLERQGLNTITTTEHDPYKDAAVVAEIEKLFVYSM